MMKGKKLLQIWAYKFENEEELSRVGRTRKEPYVQHLESYIQDSIKYGVILGGKGDEADELDSPVAKET